MPELPEVLEVLEVLEVPEVSVAVLAGVMARFAVGLNMG